MVEKKFAAAFKQLRNNRGVSQEKFAAQIGVHRTYLSQLERGLKSPTLKTLIKISIGLDIKLSKLFKEIENDV